MPKMDLLHSMHKIQCFSKLVKPWKSRIYLRKPGSKNKMLPAESWLQMLVTLSFDFASNLSKIGNQLWNTTEESTTKTSKIITKKK